MITLQNNLEVDVAIPVQGKNGKWSSTFETFRITGSTAHLMNTIESAPVWEDAAAAVEGAHRALATLEETGKYPNMCEVW